MIVNNVIYNKLVKSKHRIPADLSGVKDCSVICLIRANCCLSDIGVYGELLLLLGESTVGQVYKNNL